MYSFIPLQIKLHVINAKYIGIQKIKYGLSKISIL
jgi:hypothetical protein